jgi:hypothetical protein
MAHYTKLVTHDSCMDGLAVAMIVRDAIPDIEVVFAQYGTPSLEQLPATSGLLFCDITPPRARVAEFVEAGATVLDHHKHAQDIVAQFGARGVFADEAGDLGVSGATLAFRHVWVPVYGARSAVETFARWVGVRDTWQRKSPEWEAANDMYASMAGLPREYWLQPCGIHDALSPRSLELGRMWRAERDRTVSRICKGGTINLMDPKGRHWSVFPDTDHYVSDVASVLISANVTCGWFQRAELEDLVTVLSLRSQDGSVDVGALAKRFGGGGHSRAAGCALHECNPLIAVATVMNAGAQ